LNKRTIKCLIKSCNLTWIQTIRILNTIIKQFIMKNCLALTVSSYTVGCKSNEENLKFTDKVEKHTIKLNFQLKKQCNLIFRVWGTERMDAKFTILTNSTKGVIEYKMVRKLFSIKIKYSILPLSQMKIRQIWRFYGNIFLFLIN
jgi:hypothetical protein